MACGAVRPTERRELDAAGKIDGLLRAARYKKGPEVAEAARQALEGYLDRIIQRLDTKNMVQLRPLRPASPRPPAPDRPIYVLQQGHLHRRQDARHALGMMKDPVAVKPLCVAMHNPDPPPRTIAVEALGKIATLRPRTCCNARSARSSARLDAARKSLRQVGAPPGQS